MINSKIAKENSKKVELVETKKFIKILESRINTESKLGNREVEKICNENKIFNRNMIMKHFNRLGFKITITKWPYSDVCNRDLITIKW